MFWLLRHLYRGLSKRRLVIGSFRSEEFNGRLSEDYHRRMAPSFQARLASKLQRADPLISHCKWVGEQYEKGLREMGMRCIPRIFGSEPVLLRYPILVKNKSAILRKAKRRRIELGAWFVSVVDPLAQNQLNSVGYDMGSCPIAGEVSEHLITLPIYRNIRWREIERSLEFLSDFRDLIC